MVKQGFEHYLDWCQNLYISADILGCKLQISLFRSFISYTKNLINIGGKKNCESSVSIALHVSDINKITKYNIKMIRI